MKRRQFLQLGSLGALAPSFAFAQARSAKVGMLAAIPFSKSVFAPAIVKNLADLGYRERAGLTLEYRWAEGSADNYPKLARELVDLKCDVIFAIGAEQPAKALRDLGSRVPVVFIANDYDPLEKGIVKSLARPEGTLTGVYVPQSALVGKRVEILREVMPSARRFLVLADAISGDQLPAARNAAQRAGVQVTVVEFAGQPYDYAGAFEAGRKADVQGVVVLTSPIFLANIPTLADLLQKYRLPSIGTGRFADGGLLISYSGNASKVARRASEIAVMILKGAKPSGIPVEQADEFELVINSKTARALGLKIPESVMARATRIVQ